MIPPYHVTNDNYYTYPRIFLKITSVGSRFSLAVGGTHLCVFAGLALAEEEGCVLGPVVSTVTAP